MSITRLQIEGLHLLGYTKRESEFLFLVATHSGYFTNRQFKSFAQTESGSVSHAFIRKLLERKHATYHAYPQKARTGVRQDALGCVGFCARTSPAPVSRNRSGESRLL